MAQNPEQDLILPTKGLLAGAIIATLVAMIIVVTASWPMITDPTGMVLGASQNDFYGIAWGLYHVWESLRGGTFPGLETHAIAWPEGASLLVSDLPEAILLAPVTAIGGPTLAFNVLQVLHHALAAGAAWWCARRMGISNAGAAATAAAFAFSPAFLATTFNQNPDVTAWYWVPLTAGLAVDSRSIKSSLLAGTTAGLAAWCNPYGGVMALLVLLALHPTRPVHRWGAGLALAAVFASFYAFMLESSVRARHSVVPKGSRMDTVHGVAQLCSLVTPRPLLQSDIHWDASRFTHWSYLGTMALLLGIAGLLLGRRWRWLLLFSISLAFSLGPVIHLHGQELFPGPYALLDNLPGLQWMHLGYRYTVLSGLCLGIGAGLLTTTLRRFTWVPVLLLLGDVMLVSSGWRLLAPDRPFDDGSCQLLKDLPPGPVLDLPPTHGEFWIFSSTCHGNPVAEGINLPLTRSVHDALSHNDPMAALLALRSFGFRYLVYHSNSPRADSGWFPELPTAGQRCAVAENTQGVTVMDLRECNLDFR